MHYSIQIETKMILTLNLFFLFIADKAFRMMNLKLLGTRGLTLLKSSCAVDRRLHMVNQT